MSKGGVLVVEGAHSRRVRGLTEKVARVWALRRTLRGDRVVLEGTERAVRRAARALAARGVSVSEGAAAEVERLSIAMESSMDAAEALIAAQEVADSLSEVVSRVSRLMAEDMQAAYSQLATAVDPDAADRWREEVATALERLVKTALEAQSTAVRASSEVAERSEGLGPGHRAPEPFAAPREEPGLAHTGDDDEIDAVLGPQRPRGGEEPEGETEEPEHPARDHSHEGEVEDEKGEGEMRRKVGESRSALREAVDYLRRRRPDLAEAVVRLARRAAEQRRRLELVEAWGVETRPPESERGKYEDATIDELCRVYRAYRRWRRGEGRKPTYKGKPADIHEIMFAIRAKSHKYRWGSVKKICGIED